MDKRQVIGITFGAWDLFHRGHDIFLKRCRQYCDILLVGVVSDYYLKVQKGHDRPKHSIERRINAVSEYADKVFEFDTLDVTQYIQLADVWIKGADQRNMKTHDRVQYLRPKIVVLPRTPDISTSQLIKEKYEPEKIKHCNSYAVL